MDREHYVESDRKGKCNRRTVGKTNRTTAGHRLTAHLNGSEHTHVRRQSRTQAEPGWNANAMVVVVPTHTHCLPACLSQECSWRGVGSTRTYGRVNGRTNARTDLPGVLVDGPVAAVVTGSFCARRGVERARESVGPRGRGGELARIFEHGRSSSETVDGRRRRPRRARRRRRRRHRRHWTSGGQWTTTRVVAIKKQRCDGGCQRILNAGKLGGTGTRDGRKKKSRSKHVAAVCVRGQRVVTNTATVGFLHGRGYFFLLLRFYSACEIRRTHAHGYADIHTDRRTDGRTNERTDGRTDGRAHTRERANTHALRGQRW